ncbi:hypothetical protein [uncultured Bacteroides sp.]|uniref:hypothetical protein n=1 Tax=uncultured Bacteroides sp. TaxID=162156 RepID=UPI00262AEE97|nr:hypothetical protein [uncultured Bacteroides sp.]
MKHFVQHIIVFLMILATIGCQDEFIKEEIIGKGMANVSATLDFKPMSSALTQTRSAGNALKEIDSLHVLLYDSKKELIENWTITEYTESDEDRTNADAENNKSAEAQTKRATFKLPKEIGFGKYYMYAVANIPGLLTNDKYANAIKTVDGLKSIPLIWNTEDISANGQMIGYFTNSFASTQSSEEDELLVIKEKSVKLHAWLRRAASKVTVAFNATKLRENVRIYLKSVQIKDIPISCFLGKRNAVTDDSYPSEKLIQEGEKIDYTGGNPEYLNWPYLRRGDFYGLGAATQTMSIEEQKKKHHAEDVQALYFYENMQGKGIEGTASDKRQDVSGKNENISYPDGNTKPDGTSEHEPSKTGFKDAKPYGTYIEVEAYYYNGNAGDLTYGKIIYRFMLGKDVHLDYNAERNHHYKLTLQFNGNANDVDWHIEYEEEEPEIYSPAPYYISYLYNHGMTYPLRIKTGGKTVKEVKAEITDNRWAPRNPGNFSYWKSMDIPKENLWNGFLSLHKTTETRIQNPNNAPYKINSNQAFYEKSPKRGERVYTIPEGLQENDPQTLTGNGTDVKKDDIYTVTKEIEDEKDILHLEVPMYTRAKQLIKGTAYTGNNPYVAYQRSATVKFTVTFTDEYKIEKEVEIIQAHRIVNPKGVYRSYNNTKSFHAVLKILEGEDQTQFAPLKSDGPWKAYVVGGTAGLVSLRPGKKEDSEEKDGTVYGRTDSEMDFHIDFNPDISVGANESKYAIIRVEYNNYTCQHLIFIRRGYAPDELLPGGAKWHTKNMLTASSETDSPIEEGSLFKYGNWSQPIAASNNKNPENHEKGYWINVKPSDFKGPGSTPLALESGGSSPWQDITSQGSSGTGFDSSTFRVAKVKDYADLYKSEFIEQGYGVLYGDEAEETLTDLNEVYGVNPVKGHGMRGCFVYNRNLEEGYQYTARNVFFPLGASGYGHRKSKEDGMLRYSCNRSSYFLVEDDGITPIPPDSKSMYYPDGINAAPLFYDLYKRPGAIYWVRTRETDNYFNHQGAQGDGNNIVGWDFNYFTFDYYPIVVSNVWGKTIWDNGAAAAVGTENTSDACFIRCVD